MNYWFYWFFYNLCNRREQTTRYWVCIVCVVLSTEVVWVSICIVWIHMSCAYRLWVSFLWSLLWNKIICELPVSAHRSWILSYVCVFVCTHISESCVCVHHQWILCLCIICESCVCTSSMNRVCVYDTWENCVSVCTSVVNSWSVPIHQKSNTIVYSPINNFFYSLFFSFNLSLKI